MPQLQALTSSHLRSQTSWTQGSSSGFGTEHSHVRIILKRKKDRRSKLLHQNIEHGNKRNSSQSGEDSLQYFNQQGLSNKECWNSYCKSSRASNMSTINPSSHAKSLSRVLLHLPGPRTWAQPPWGATRHFTGLPSPFWIHRRAGQETVCANTNRWSLH